MEIPDRSNESFFRLTRVSPRSSSIYPSLWLPVPGLGCEEFSLRSSRSSLLSRASWEVGIAELLGMFITSYSKWEEELGLLIEVYFLLAIQDGASVGIAAVEEDSMTMISFGIAMNSFGLTIQACWSRILVAEVRFSAYSARMSASRRLIRSVFILFKSSNIFFLGSFFAIPSHRLYSNFSRLFTVFL